MQSGLLRKRLTIQQRSQSQDSYGQPLTVWADVATVWGEISPMSGSEMLSAQAVQSSLSHSVTIRYHSGVNPKMRIKYGIRLFDIQNVIDENERHRTMTLLCIEGLSDG
ncbi:gp16_SPP1, putative phage head-tail adaptor [uncultured Caudovirales phage]|uniref:Gp16_SPP1, putative phage head-tail adaptor n=1 Tax=uncultured Caudovirales phage TaxID=2100421 RepID=A0A6J5KJ04_9CAUD|nr:gp16_SPP1, putative phage head-tail adaptor [uncultured Caudovirales phage]